jgi:hypothetical protein
VLALALVFEGAVWIVAFREFRKNKSSRGWLNAFRSSKDPAVFTVLLEDTAAMFGLLTAMVGVASSQALDMPVLDGVASIAIGVILAGTAASGTGVPEPIDRRGRCAGGSRKHSPPGVGAGRSGQVERGANDALRAA